MSASQSSQPWAPYPAIPRAETPRSDGRSARVRSHRAGLNRPRFPVITQATPGSIPGTQSSQSPMGQSARIFVTLSSSPNTQQPPSPFNRPPTNPPNRPLPPPPAFGPQLELPAASRPAIRGENGHLSFQSTNTRYLSPPVPADKQHFPPISQAFQCPPTPATALPRHMQLPNRVGLGIDGPEQPTPSITIEPIVEDVEKASSPNLAQRVESRLWKYNHSDNVLLRWCLEIVSWLISAMSMAAIVGMLLALHDKERPNNWVFGLTVNTYVAILSRLATAGLLVPTSEALGQLKWFVGA